METVRGLLLGTPIGENGAIAVAWCAGIAAASHRWARHTFAKS
jgi:ABC-2 type transport system permease protein